MNLNANATIGELRELVRQRDDLAGHHVLWVDKSGEVQITCIPVEKKSVPNDRPPVGFEESHQGVQLCYETFLAGNEYVGPEAADDDEWISMLFESLNEEWRLAGGNEQAAYIAISSGLFDERHPLSRSSTCPSS